MEDEQIERLLREAGPAAPSTLQLVSAAVGQSFDQSEPGPELVGGVLADRYVVEAEIGRGGSGAVYRAYDRATRATVAIKLIAVMQGRRRGTDLLYRELRLGRAIQHANVCRIYDVFETRGRHFLAMEYAPAGTLRDLFAESLPLAGRLSAARAVIAGVAAVHRAGFIHQDVKPENVLRFADGRLAVSDFGLARTADAITTCSLVGGTPGYLAPEVVLGAAPTAASDIYGLGVILHELFFGTRPTWTTNDRGRRWQAPSASSRSTLGFVARLIGECLAETPTTRPRNAIELAASFEAAVQGRPWRSRSRSWRLLPAGLGLVALAASLGVYLFHLRASSRAVNLASGSVQFVGEPRDLLSRSRLITTLPARLFRLDALPGGIAVRVVPQAREQPALDIDPATGATSVSPLSPEVRWPSPVLSPDGASLTYQTSAYPLRMMLRPRATEARAIEIGEGGNPVWFPSAKEFLFLATGHRLAVGSAEQRPAYFTPDPNIGPGHRLYSFDVSPAGDQVAAHFTSNAVRYADSEMDEPLVDKHRDDQVTRYDYPSMSRRDTVRLPPGSFLSQYTPASRPTLVVGTDVPGGKLFAEFVSPGVFRRLWSLPTGDKGDFIVEPIVTVAAGQVWALEQQREYLELTNDSGQTRRIRTAHAGLDYAWGWPGNLLVNEFDGARLSIVHYVAATGDIARVSAGPADGTPNASGDGRWFAYSDYDNGALKVCAMNDPGACRTIKLDGMGFGLPALSFDGGYVAYLTGAADSDERLCVLALKTKEVIEMGRAPSCHVRWTGPTTVMVYNRLGRKWIESDLRSRGPTGRTEPVNLADLNRLGCPKADSEATGFRVKRERQEATKLYLVPKDVAFWSSSAQ